MRVGIVLPLLEYPWKQPSYLDVRDLARSAEGAGFDSVWVFDHLLARPAPGVTEGSWEAWTMLSALAEATSTVTLGTLVLCAPFRHPAVLAKMAVTLDEISRGRLVLGLGAGWHRPEFDAYGVPFDHRATRLGEQVEILTALLHGGGPTDHDGRFYRLRDAEVRPAPHRKIPLMVAGAGPRLLALAARHAQLWNTSWYGPPPPTGGQQLLAARAAAHAACAAEGRDPATLEFTVGVNVSPGAPLAEPPHVLADHPVLAGPPEAIAEGLRRYDALGVDHLIANLDPHFPEAQRLLAVALADYRAGQVAPPRGPSENERSTGDAVDDHPGPRPALPASR